ncbi:MAG: ChaN family lipoprotein [Bacteroidales bacterium]|nr:ChaN family lipoprotein [Bacteroidales bacterium]
MKRKPACGRTTEPDYKPLMEMAVDSSLPFIATNIPRRYAALVNTKGLEALDSLSQEAKKWMAPLPVEFDSTLTGYEKMKEMMGGMGGHGNMNIVKAQAVKDATMAHFIAENLQPGKQFIHYNGAYHSDNFEGIIWYLNRVKPDLNIKTITTKEQADLNDLKEDHEGIADFIIAVDKNMTKTY